MRVALLTTFNASKKEPLATLLERIYGAFQEPPLFRFSLSDAPIPGFVSSIDRVLKRFPDLEKFVTASPTFPGGLPIRRIANSGDTVLFPTLLAIAIGVPKSFPFHNVTIQLHSAAFGEPFQPNQPGGLMPGIMVGDSWWVSGRVRSLSALTIVEAEAADKKLPPLPEAVVAIFAACGKIKSTVQVPFPNGSAPTAVQAAAPDPEVAQAVRAVIQDYRARMADILDRAALPHDLPPALEVLQSSIGQTTGPKKPVLVRAFKPLGYDCHSESGTFTLRRRTPGNLTVEISLDVGTWSRSLTAMFQVQGLGFRATLPLPVSRRAMGSMQYPIGDADRWQQLVDNLAALVAELERTFVPAVEAASGPAPEWYKPET